MEGQRERNHLTRSARVRGLVASMLVLVLLAVGASEALGQGGSDPVADAGCSRILDYPAATFDPDSDVVDNPLLPLAPGTQRVFVGRSKATGTDLPHRVSFTVTGLTKVVDGVRGAVVWDVDESDGRVAEAELAIFAQDADGNVWNLGEYPEEYPGGVFRGAPSTWFAGVGEAEPGVHMLELPAVGTAEYLQGFVPEIDFLDCAKIEKAGASVTVPAGDFTGVLVIHERSPLDPAGGVQVKHHAPDVGIVKIEPLADPHGEELVLEEHNVLSPSQLQEANRQAHILDQRGIQCSEVYAQTAAPGATSALEGPDNGDYGPYTCAAPAPPPVTGGTTTPAPFSTPLTPSTLTETTPPAAVVPENPLEGGYRARVDHPLFPLKQGQTMLYKGKEDDVKLRVESRVRDTRVRVAGVRATAVDVKESEDGKLVERSTDFYAQDGAGNVWYLGERVDEIENGRVTGHDGQWIAGRKGAKRGLFMPAAPAVGQSFRQTRAPGVSRDRATVVAVDAAVTTRAGEFTGCLKTRDKDLRSGSRPERKYYCPNVGLVREQQHDGIVDLARFG